MADIVVRREKNKPRFEQKDCPNCTSTIQFYMNDLLSKQDTRDEYVVCPNCGQEISENDLIVSVDDLVDA